MLKNNKEPVSDYKIPNAVTNMQTNRLFNPVELEKTKKYSFNQSELMKTIDDTIDIKLAMSFQNSEITGRSTMCNEVEGRRSNTRPLSPSIENILATSCSADVRNFLSASKQELSFLQNHTKFDDSVPKTEKSYWDITNIAQHNVTCKTNSITSIDNDAEFKSGHLMESKLLADELEWKKQFAILPVEANEQEFKTIPIIVNTSTRDNDPVNENQTKHFDSSTSITSFFDKKSDDLREMLPHLSPKKKMMPAPLHKLTPSVGKENRAGKSSLENIDLYIAQFNMNDSPNAIIQKLVNQHGSRRNETIASISSRDSENQQRTRSSLKSDTHTTIGSLNTSLAFTEDGLVSGETDDVNDLNISTATGASKIAERKERILTSENLNDIDDYGQDTPGLLKAQKSSPLWSNPGPSEFLVPNTMQQKMSLPVFGSNFHHMRSNSQSPTSQKSNFGSQNEIGGVVYGFPIKSSKSEIAWGSVKLRQRAENTVKLKNISNKKVTLKVYISGPGFQFTSVDNNCIITLQRQECSTFSVTFCPTIIGSAVGKIAIHLVNTENANSVRFIPLYGYGGHAILHVEGVQLGPIGPQGLKFLPLGDFRNLTQPIKKHFRLINRGTLPAFVMIEVKTKMHDIFIGTSSIRVQPDKFIIDSNASREISLVFNPRCDEIKKFLKNNSDVLPIANLSILYGDEPTRHRIKRLVKKNNKEQKNVHNKLNDICTKFVREITVNDIQMLRESWGVLNSLIDNFHTEEIEVTLNRNMDETLMNFTLDMEDESLMFRTIIASPLREADCKYKEPGEYEIDPSYVQIGNVSVIRDLTIKNISFEKMRFVIVSDAAYISGIEPREGFIRPDSKVCVQLTVDNDDFNFNLYKTEDDCNFVVVQIGGKNISIPTCLQNN